MEQINFKVTSHLQRPKKSFLSFYLTIFQSVILSSVYKRKKNLKKRPSYLEKTYFQIVNKLRRCHNLANRGDSSYFMLFAYFYLHHVLEKIPTWKLFTLTLTEKSKSEKSPWAKKTKTTRLSEIKKVLQCDASPRKSYLLSQTLGGPVVPLVCGFRSYQKKERSTTT